MKKTLLLFAALLTSMCSNAQIFAGLYAFDSVKTTSGLTDPSPLPMATGVVFGSFSATGTPANPNATARFSFTNWPMGAANAETVYANLTGSASSSEYYEVTVAPAVGFTIDLTSITFTFGRSGTGVRTYAVRSDADAYAANLPASINPLNANLSVQTGDIFFLNTDITTTSQSGSTITLSGASFTSLSAPRTFRFYGWNSEATTGTFSIDNVTINGIATAPTSLSADFTSSVTAACLGSTVDFTDISTGPNTILSWLWDFGNATGTSTSANPSYTYASPGTYSVLLTVMDNMSNIDTISHMITIYDNPVSSFLVPTSTCAGTVVQFVDTSSVMAGTIVSWDWDFGDPASGANNTSILQDPTHTYYTQANYTVTEIVTSSFGCKDTSTVLVFNDSIGAVLTSANLGGTVIGFTGANINGTGPFTFSMDFGDGSGISTVANNMHTYSGMGPYTACLTVSDGTGCMDSTCVVVLDPTSITNISNTNVVSIQPNPSNTGVFVLNVGSVSKASIIVYNIIGKVILQKEAREGKQSIDLSAEANGSYFVTIKTDKEVFTKKVIINK